MRDDVSDDVSSVSRSDPRRVLEDPEASVDALPTADETLQHITTINDKRQQRAIEQLKMCNAAENCTAASDCLID